MRRTKTICSYLLMFFLLFAMGISVDAAETYGRSTVTEQDYNIILLIDKSGSMNRTDGSRMALSAAEQFVDQLCTAHSELASTTNVGVLAFSQRTELIAPLQKLDSENNVDSIKADIDKIAYDRLNTGGTDLGTALYDAIEQLQRQTTENRRNIIVMFTDGYSENVLDEQESESNLGNAFEMISELECEVFIVGLNQQDSIKPEGRAEIYQLANKAQLGEGIQKKAEDDLYARGDMVNYLITDNMNSVREFYGKIYAYMIGGSLEPLNEDYQFSITTGGVREADVIVFSDSEITELSIVRPEGNVMKEDGRSFFIEGDDFYKIAKIMEPELGLWTVQVKSADENKTYVIRLYSIEAALSATWGERGEFEGAGIDAEHVGQVVVTPMYKSEQYRDDSLAGSLTVKEYTVTKGDSSETYLLEYDQESGKFVGYFPVTAGQYHITATLASDTMNRKAGCDLTVNIAGDDSEQADGETGAEENNVVDVMKENQPTESKDPEIVAHWYYLALAAAMIFMLIIVVIIIQHKTAIVNGDFEIYIKGSKPGEAIENTVSHPRGKKFSLWKLVEQVIDNNTNDDADANGRKVPQENKTILKMLKKHRAQIASIKLVICENKNQKRVGKRKTYKLDNGKGDIKELNRKQVCYATPELWISLVFKPLLTGENEDEEEWGVPTEEIVTRRKTRRR